MINPPIRRQPHDSVSFRWIIPMLGLVRMWVYWQHEHRWVAPPPQCSVLDNMIKFKSLYPLLVLSPTQGAMNNGHIAECLTGTRRIHLISIDKECRINSYPYPIRRRNDPYLDRVQFDVAALEGEEEEEGARENREQWESDVHDGYSIRI